MQLRLAQTNVWAKGKAMFETIWTWYPPVGVFIGILALLSVVVSLFRDAAKITKVEKAAWIAVFFALVGLELRSIYRDRSAHDREQAAARKEQLEHFTKIATGLTSAIDQEQKHFDATVSEMQQLVNSSNVISRQSLASLNSVTGGDSFCFLELNGARNGLVMFHPGDYQLTDVSVELTDYTKPQDENFEHQTVPPHTVWLTAMNWQMETVKTFSFALAQLMVSGWRRCSCEG